MNKLKCTKMVFCCVVLGLGLRLSPAQSQPAQYGSQESITLNIGRDNPFAKIFDDQKTMLQEASRLSQTDANLPKLFLETITLKTLDAESFGPLIEGMRSSYGRISVDKNSNTLIIYDTREALAKIKELVPQKEIVSENRVHKSYRIVYADIKEVEETLRTFISKTGNLSANPSTSNILVEDFESNIKVIDSFINEIDRITPQILVEVRIYDVSTDEDFDLGVEWNAGRNSTERESLGSAVTVTDSTSYGVGEDTTPGDTSASTIAGARGTTTRTSTPFVAGSYDELTGGSIRLGLLNDALDIDVALNILHEQDFAKLLANPRIMVLDNEQATFEIVREIPYLEVNQTEEGGSMSGYKFKNVGVKLVVTPHVTREGMVRLHIQPEFGVRVGTGSGAPTVDTRKVDTIALVKDSQTVVLGGLRKNETTQDTWKVPLFGDIPLLGGLFRSETESVETTELLVFITPRIIVEPTLSPGEREQLKDTEFATPKKPTLWIERNSE